jgi:hypothetical protein
MITLRISNSNQEFQNSRDIDENWILEQINRRRHNGEKVCVRVSVNVQPVHVSLSTPGCPGIGGGGRLPNEEEKKVFDLWDKLGLNKGDFGGGTLIAFFRQLHHIID